jgi:phosphoketolase
MTTDLKTLDAWWRAANYLAVGQIYLMDNPLLREPLAPEHIKPRLLATGARRLASPSSGRTSTG